MIGLRCTCCLLLLGITSFGFSQTKDAIGKKEETRKVEVPVPLRPAAASKDAGVKGVPGDVQVHFLDGCVIRMIIQSEKLDIATPYGTLAVPVADLLAIEFGLHYPEGAAARIEAAVAKLGSADFRERDRASKVLVEMGPLAYPALLEARRSQDLEVSRRAKDVVTQLQANHPKKDLRASGDDKVITPRFTIVGRILTPTIRASTELFGPVELSLAKMQTLRAVGSRGRAQEVVIAIDAAKYAVAGQWLDSGFEADGETKVLITAKGAVDSWPQQPGQWMVGPAGMAGGQMMVGGANVVINRGGFVPGKGQIVPQVHGGALFGRIGEDGDPFMIGAQYEGTLEKNGKLYLHIAPSAWGCNSTGSYEVKITRSN